MDSLDVSVHLLGPVQVSVSGHVVSGFRSAKTLALLAYLIVEQRPVARNHLAELLWPEATQAEGRGHLRRALHDLTQRVPGAIWIDYYTAQVNPTLLSQTDVARFEMLRMQEDESGLAEAAALCRGQFLEGLELDDCPNFETWLMVEREMRRKQASALLEQLLNRYTAAGQFDLAATVGWRLLQLDPWQEERYQRLMLLLVRNGELLQAIRLYRRYSRMLEKELELEPTTATKDLYQRIRQVWRQRPGNLPQQLTLMAGDTAELGALTGLLRDPNCRLITVTGPGGCGKSRLSLAAAARANGDSGYHFLDGVFHVPLDGAIQADLPTLIGRALGIIAGGAARATMDMLLRRLHDREHLVVLDRFDHLIAHRRLLAMLLDAAPGLKLLVTCQERLRLPAERVFAVPNQSPGREHVSSARYLTLPICPIEHYIIA